MKKIFTAIAALMLAFAPLTHMSAQNSTSQNSTSQANVNGHLSLETVVKTLDLQRCSLRLGLYDKNSKFMPIKKV